MDSTASGPDPSSVDPIEGLVKLFVTEKTVRAVTAVCPVRRGAFRRYHGGAFGTFTIRPAAKAEFGIGIFRNDALPAWVRFSSDTGTTSPDYQQVCGIGIKLFIPDPAAAPPTQDFVLENFPNFFVDSVQEMYEDSLSPAAYEKAHPAVADIVAKMGGAVGSVTTIPYWSVLPSKLGARAVKYKLIPDGSDVVPPAAPAPAPAPDYLGIDLRQRLWQGAVHFTFCIQLQKDGMLIDQPTVAWSEELSPPIPVADLVLPQQDINARGQAEYVENLAFSPWHTLPEHEPLGLMQAARRRVYAASAAARHWSNGIPDTEPAAPRPPQAPF